MFELWVLEVRLNDPEVLEWYEVIRNVIVEYTPKLLSLSADLMTTVVGGATIFAFFKYGRRLTALLKIIKFQHLQERKSEIFETLDLISVASIPKGRALEVRGLFGRLNGQLGPICGLVPQLKSAQAQVQEIAHQSGRLNEPIKQQLVHHIRAVFEHAKYEAVDQAARGEK